MTFMLMITDVPSQWFENLEVSTGVEREGRVTDVTEPPIVSVTDPRQGLEDVRLEWTVNS